MTDAARFDELIHPATRLSIVALLAAADWADFTFIRDYFGLSDSALSKQLGTLEEAGYVTIERPLSERRRRVRARLTPLGREALYRPFRRSGRSSPTQFPRPTSRTRHGAGWSAPGTRVSARAIGCAVSGLSPAV